MTDARCIPPFRPLIPEMGDDWAKVAFQPILYLTLWIAAVVIFIVGDRHTVPFPDNVNPLFWVWGGLSIVCPLAALGAVRLLRHASNPRWKYRGLWLRLAADIFQLTAMSAYLAMRMAEGDYQIYPVAALIAATVFVGHLVMRDCKHLKQVENLATDLRNGHGDLQ